MNQPSSESHLPANLAEQVAGIPKALVPATLKALDRLVGGLVDIPVAWLAQQKAKIDAQTEGFRAVELAIANAAAAEAAADPETVNRAANLLVRKAYGKQINREAVGAEAVRQLGKQESPPDSEAAHVEPDEEWLNVFERYAEEASTERMQKLWGRVLAGEIRSRGAFSMRSLRFLSEFSQSDALLFADFCQNIFAECVPIATTKPEGDIRDLLNLQAAGLVDGVDGNGLELSFTFDEQGFAFFREGNLALLLTGEPNAKVNILSYTLTPIGRELIQLLDRDPRQCARKVAEAIKTPQIKTARLAIPNGPNRLLPIEQLWTEAGTTEAA